MDNATVRLPRLRPPYAVTFCIVDIVHVHVTCL